MKKTILLAVLLLVVAAVAITAVLTSRRAQPQAPGYAASMPERTCLYIGFKNLRQARNTCPAFDIAGELRQLGLPSKVRAILEAAKETEEKAEEIEKVLKALDLLRDVLRSFASMAIVGDEVALAVFDNGTAQPPSLVAAVRVRGTKAAGALDLAVKKTAQALDAREEEWEEDGIRCRTLVIKDLEAWGSDLSPSFAFPGDQLFFSTSREGLKELIKCSGGGCPSLANSERFREVVRHLPAGGQGFNYIDFGRMVSLTREYLAGPGRKILESSIPADSTVNVNAVLHYLDGYLALAGVLSASGARTSYLPDGVRHEAYFLLEESALKGELAGFFQVKPAGFKSDRFIAKRAVSYQASLGVDSVAGTLYKWAKGLLESEPVYGQPFVTRWEEAQLESEFTLENDVLPWVGSEFAAAAVGVPVMGTLGHLAYLLEVKDEAKARMALEKLARIIVEQGESDVHFSTESYKGVDVTKVQLPFPLVIVQPCYAVTKGFLIIASDRATLEEMIDCAGGKGETIRSGEKFRRMAAHMNEPANGIDFVDVRKQLEGIASSFETVLSMQRMVMEGGKQGEKGFAERKATLELMEAVVKAIKAFQVVDAVATRVVFDGKGYRMSRVVSMTRKK